MKYNVLDIAMVMVGTVSDCVEMGKRAKSQGELGGGVVWHAKRAGGSRSKIITTVINTLNLILFSLIKQQN